MMRLLNYFQLSGFGIICQVATVIFPGKEPMMFYVCLGRIPKKYIGIKSKSNLSFNCLALFSIVSNVFIICRYKCRIPRKNKTTPMQQKFSVHAFVSEKMEKESLFRCV
jgi:hypothetical protein